VADIGGEAFNRGNSARQRAGHFPQHAGQIANFVGAVPQVRNGIMLSPDGMAHRFCGVGQLVERSCDRACEIERDQHGDHKRTGKDIEDRKAHIGHCLVDARPIAGQHQCAEDMHIALNRKGHAEDQIVVRVAPYLRCEFTG